MTFRHLRCYMTPPFHHVWKVASDVHREPHGSGFTAAGMDFDPSHGAGETYVFRCRRCGLESVEDRPLARGAYESGTSVGGTWPRDHP